MVAAAADIKIGTVLAATDLTTVQIVGTAPKSAILDPKNAIGRGVTSSLYAGEPILDNRLAPMGSGGGFAATIRMACARSQYGSTRSWAWPDSFFRVCALTF